MKKIIITMLISTLVLFGVFAGGKAEGSSDKGTKNVIRVGTEGTYKPYSYHNEQGILTGFDIEVIQAIATYLKLDIKFSESRWDGLLAGLNSDRWDLVANQVWWNESRAEEYLLSDKYLVAGASVLVKADNPAKSSGGLKGQKAAVSLTSSFRPYVEELTDKIEFQDDFQLAAGLLSSGRVDFVVNDIQTIGLYLKENPDAGLKAIKLDNAKTTDVVFALGKDKKELLEKINEALAALKSDGTLKGITDTYFAEVK